MWELTDENKSGAYRFRPYQPTYIMPWKSSNRLNEQPTSPTLGKAAPEALTTTESRFQLSFKIKLWEDVMDSPVALWLGYTQQTNWQLYNRVRSSPMHGTDYEPSLILTVPTDINFLGMHWKMLNAGIVHQSNGRYGAYSRGWNRIYLQVGVEHENYLFMIRPWYHLSKLGGSKHNNPDIRQYMGDGDIQANWIGEEHWVSALGRYSFRGRKGAIKLSWAFPIKGYLKGYVEYFNGYGESLIDYNHRQQTIGLGLLISTWP